MITQPILPQESIKLFIDESGTGNPLDLTSDIYILSGCVIKKSDCQDVKIRADQIKFKYWNKTNIMFHSREIGRRDGAFSILKDETLSKQFLADLESFLADQKFKMLFVVVDKAKAKNAGWNEVKVYKDTTLHLVRNFLLALLATNSKGEIIIESATATKDIYLLQAVGYFLASGIESIKIDYQKIQTLLTSISFVTKHNNDIEEQIADLFCYAAQLKYQQKAKQKISGGIYEQMILRAFNRSIFKVPQYAGPKKARFFAGLEPFLVIP
ncbi:MAG: hypothetical protein A3C08_02680 [Candidatus Taylorbacteria bacterium RIFCSPHIGHO2_02_FULL_47_18]|uniref:DUF3800 domain-containing protein n=1 Tax=Candidatus Taylorbacteria bacterium RIFCSPLOWO2_01_FULL_48_100 TaxID=1802322 RepID=A0A1G2NDY1_9BACT|nr:MAG: hypothetical protein A2670_02390 [Candidatus Taylorbacteria bacterium RIFCSPHIGHO2_01_FULL_48_38]OHA27606.1 MAG: hypothetical protein A3C08_02680 [Candidatus Taylorbacteria bacterium RIFCSPHIGHO2_02_FULL_47_18]OHA34298.1 MAG: hypothetical protein A2938_02065 [Candidatus Taylorbacteria bacterium RIFCSPLOWO2_01_FULL_48_100]OHA40452.1 MAG: hypothetical protein A3J31_02700 [Candidatus Taylorbacteria bacterium RIFCSPLOWO2_02_FULL_48_16]OHA44908.1 MAG: hypothetical protein A3H13_03325 [Candid